MSSEGGSKLCWQAKPFVPVALTPVQPLPVQPTLVTLPARCHYPHAIPGSYYDHLNLKRTCTKADIEKSYQKWRDQGYRHVKAVDALKADTLDRIIVDANNVLSNDEFRRAYDAMLPPMTSLAGE